MQALHARIATASTLEAVRSIRAELVDSEGDWTALAITLGQDIMIDLLARISARIKALKGV